MDSSWDHLLLLVRKTPLGACCSSAMLITSQYLTPSYTLNHRMVHVGRELKDPIDSVSLTWGTFQGRRPELDLYLINQVPLNIGIRFTAVLKTLALRKQSFEGCKLGLQSSFRNLKMLSLSVTHTGENPSKLMYFRFLHYISLSYNYCSYTYFLSGL